MNWRIKDKIIEAICKGETLYIKDTGIAVIVDYFGTDIRENNWSYKNNKRKKEHEPCKVDFIGIPNKKALSLCEKYHIKRNSHSKTMELEGVIKIDKLSLTPFEGKAAKVLYEKVKKSK